MPGLGLEPEKAIRILRFAREVPPRLAETDFGDRPFRHDPEHRVFWAVFSLRLRPNLRGGLLPLRGLAEIGSRQRGLLCRRSSGESM